MTTFVQFHLLTSYGPSNPNRDDQGRPKQAVVGGVPRLRLSSQSLKRALRESSFFAQDLKGHMGERSRRFGVELFERLKKNYPGEDHNNLKSIAATIQRVFANIEDPKRKKGEEPDEHDGLKGTTLAFVSPEEWMEAEQIAESLLAGEKAPKPKEIAQKLLRKADGAIDIAMFGRMLTDETKDGKVVIPRADRSRDAAVQVGHAITTHTANAEEDWYSAVDDLNKAEDTGAGHLGETAFGSGIYYLYVCVNCDLLIENLAGDRDLAVKGAEALTRALAQATPRGKQNSFAHHPMAFHIRAERGTRAPRDLSGAFFTPVDRKLKEVGANDLQSASVKALEGTAQNIDACYFDGKPEEFRTLDTLAGAGSLTEIVRFVADAVRGA